MKLLDYLLKDLKPEEICWNEDGSLYLYIGRLYSKWYYPDWVNNILGADAGIYRFRIRMGSGSAGYVQGYGHDHSDKGRCLQGIYR